MTIQLYRITAREKWHDFAFSDIEDFKYEQAPSSVSADSLLSNPNISLYSLDLKTRRAVFTQTPDSIDLETSAFMFRGQFENATHVITLPFDDFHKLADRIEFQENAVSFIHSVGRCGSTLVSKAFQSLPHVRSLSEPDTLTLLVNWRGTRELEDEELQRLTRSCIAFCCKPLTGKTNCSHWAIKFRSQCTEICDLMAKAFTDANHIYLKRDPLSWLGSAYRAFVTHELVHDHEHKAMMEDMFAKTFPLIESLRIPGKPMPIYKVWLLNWVSNMETQQRLKKEGMTFCETDFSEIKQRPEATVQRLLQHCGLTVLNWETMRSTLEQDSQAGSSLNQDTINRPERLLPEEDREAARQFLQERGHL